MELSKDITYFAQTDFRGKKTTFGIKTADRSRHMYVIGKTGMGKSTLLENMAIQDIKNGHGLAFIDPHGKSAEMLLDYVPEERAKDVLYFAPFDLEYPISFNIMEDVGPDQRHLVVSGLMSTFKKIWEDAWSARMEYILNNTLLALLEYPGTTLLGVNRMLSDKNYRKKVVDNISDPAVRSFWVDEFAKYTERFAAEATPAIQNKVGQFTSNPLIRNIIGQPKSSFDLRRMMDEKKIVIMNLSKGRVGEQNTNLLGGMLITKIYLAAMSRANLSDPELNKLPPFFLHVDEFQSFVNESFSDILSEARKYKLNLTIAHQYIEQLPETVQSAVFGNVGTTVAFRVGPFDAEVLEKIFSPKFLQEDLVNLGFAQIYLTLMINGVGSAPFSAVTVPPIPALSESLKDKIIEESRRQFARPRKEVEGSITDWHQGSGQAPSTAKEVGTEKIERVANVGRSFPAPQIAPKIKEAESAAVQPKNDQPMKRISLHSLKPPADDDSKEELLNLLGANRSKLGNRKKVAPADKQASKEELRSALKDILGNETKPAEAKASEAGRVVTEKPADAKALTSKEVPEDVLRKMLEVESEKQ